MANMPKYELKCSVYLRPCSINSDFIIAQYILFYTPLSNRCSAANAKFMKAEMTKRGVCFAVKNCDG